MFLGFHVTITTKSLPTTFARIWCASAIIKLRAVPLLISLGFGMTELSGGSHFPVPPDGKDVLGSIGVLLPNLECKVCGNSLHDTHNNAQ